MHFFALGAPRALSKGRQFGKGEGGKGEVSALGSPLATFPVLRSEVDVIAVFLLELFARLPSTLLR
jgi:hypothetical protein